MASSDSDVIEKLLQSTGFSCDDLLKKLQQYKAAQTVQATTAESKKDLSSSLPEENVKTTNDEESVIVKTTSSSVDCDGDTTNISVKVVREILNNIVDNVVGEGTRIETLQKSDTSLCQNNDISTYSSDNEDTSVIEPIQTFEDFFNEAIYSRRKKDCETNEKNKLDTDSTSQEDGKTNEKNTLDNENALPREETCPSIYEHNYSSSKTNLDLEQDFSVSSTEDLCKSEDDLRNIIRMQLSSLRNMKKSNTYLPDLQKSLFFRNTKKKQKSCDLNPVTSATRHDVIAKESGEDNETNECSNEERDGNNASLISLSDETNFLIMDVTGGVDRITPTIEEEPEDEVRKFAVFNENNYKTETCIETNASQSSTTSEETSKINKSPRKEIKNILTNYRRKMSLNYFDESRYNLSSLRVEDKPNCITIKKDIAESFSQDPGVKKFVSNEKSPFVSDSLDDFLSESAQLKVSYSIPKLGAEEGIKEGPKEIPYARFAKTESKMNVDARQHISPRRKTKLIKAKTLADMRRQFEKLKSKNNVEPKEKPVAEDSKSKEILERSVHVKSSALIDYHKISIIPSHRNSFVVYNKKKIWTSSSFKNKCVANLDSPMKTATESLLSEETQAANKKMSILSSMRENRPCKIGYRAGPLCKKVDLQNLESRNYWTTELKTLPTMYLEVVPEVGKPINPRFVHLLPVFEDPVISEERANFALSVLKPKNEKVEPSSFKFKVSYKNNQEKMLVRKHYKPTVKDNNVEKTTDKVDTDNLEEDVSKVLHDIVSYIEVKEIADSLIKIDEAITKEDDNAGELVSKRRGFKKRRRKKLELELQRLNCKVIDVGSSVEEPKECAKPFCKLGCICKSLRCESVFSDHCQLVECMFGCKCPPPTMNNIITTNNSLSAQTLTHLEDKMKKNLAKVEREFTHTLIHTDNDVILVGSGGRKRNRTARIPKKYTDFVEHTDEIFEDPYRKNDSGKIAVKRCTVDLPKLNLDGITPYCLIHNLYNCYCIDEDITFVKQVPKLKLVKVKGDNSKSYDHKSPAGRPYQSKVFDNTCARTRQIFSEYRSRNQDPKYTNRLRVRYSHETQMRFESDLVHFEPPAISSTVQHANKPLSSQMATKRKQNFTIREDIPIDNTVDEQREFALQRRKKKVKTNEKASIALYYPIFDGEIKVSLKDNEDMLKIIGEENHSLEYLRILPWSKVIESFNLGRMNIWAKEKRPTTLLCNAAGYFPPKCFVDIRQIRQKTDIISWILADDLPPDRPRELMHLILTPKKNHFMISGYCLKKVQTTKPDQSQQQMESDDLLSSVKLEPSNNSELEAFTEMQPTVPLIQEQLSPFDESCQPPTLEKLFEKPFDSKTNCQPPTLENMFEKPTDSKTNSTEPEDQLQLTKPDVPELHPSFKKIDLECSNTGNIKIRPISLSKLLCPEKVSNVVNQESIGVEHSTITDSVKDIPTFTKPKITKYPSVLRVLPPNAFELAGIRTVVRPQMNNVSTQYKAKPGQAPTFQKQRQMFLTKNLGSKTIIKPITLSPDAKILKSFRKSSIAVSGNLSKRLFAAGTQSPTGASSISSRPNAMTSSLHETSQISKLIPLEANGKQCHFPAVFRKSRPLKQTVVKSSTPNMKASKFIQSVPAQSRNKRLLSISNSVESIASNSESERRLIFCVKAKEAEPTLSTEILRSKSDTSEKPITSDGIVQNHSIAIPLESRILVPIASSSPGVADSHIEISQSNCEEAPGGLDGSSKIFYHQLEADKRSNFRAILRKGPRKQSRDEIELLPISDFLESIRNESTLSTEILGSKSDTSEKQITHDGIVQNHSITKPLESRVLVPLASSSPGVADEISQSNCEEAPDSQQNEATSSNSKSERPLIFCVKAKEAEPTLSTQMLGSKNDTNEKQITHDGIVQNQSITKPLESRVPVPTASTSEGVADSQLEISQSSCKEAPDSQQNEATSSNIEDSSERFSESRREEVPADSEDSFPANESLKCASPVASDFGSDAEFSFNIDDDIFERLDNISDPPASKETCEKIVKQPQQTSSATKTVASFDSSKIQRKPNKKSRVAIDYEEEESCPILFKETNKKGQAVVTVHVGQSSESELVNKNETKLAVGRKMKCTHKDMHNISKTMILYTKTYLRRKLSFLDKNQDIMKINCRLPKVNINNRFRWRMIVLNSDFTFFQFIEANYSIKYTDLRDVVKMANNTGFTILLRNKEFTARYKHPNFGIYCDCSYNDRIFVGPFFPTENHQIATLRYLQGKLIDTQVFNSMIGKRMEGTLPIWLHEVLPTRSFKPIVIDISDDDDDVCVVDDLENGDDSFPDSYLCPPFVIKLTKQEVANRKVNRYMVTNVPYLGYFEANQCNNKTVEVFWPDGERGYRFANIVIAKCSMMLYLSQIFICLPQEFKISIVMLTDVLVNKVINSQYFYQPKSYVCGDFGVFPKETVSMDLLQQYNVTDIDSFVDSESELCKKEVEHKMIRLFGLSLMSTEEWKRFSDNDEILQWAKTEIYILEKLAANYESEIEDLRTLLKMKESKMQKMKLAVPSISIPALKASVKVPETIEIDDSDDEDCQNSKNKFENVETSNTQTSSNPTTTNQVQKRSVLKSEFVTKRLKPNRSLLKKVAGTNIVKYRLPIHKFPENSTNSRNKKVSVRKANHNS